MSATRARSIGGMGAQRYHYVRAHVRQRDDAPLLPSMTVMNGSEQTLTQREARVIQIPDGTPMVLPAGTSVRIAQALGDTYTLVTPRGYMVRLDAQDAAGICKDQAGAPAAGAGRRQAQVKMTLTAPGCGMGQVLADDVKRKLEGLPGIGTAEVEVVFDPPWNPNMMTEAAKLQLGMW